MNETRKKTAWAVLRADCVHPEPTTPEELDELIALPLREQGAWHTSRHGGFHSRYLSNVQRNGPQGDTVTMWTYVANDGCQFGVERWPNDTSY